MAESATTKVLIKVSRFAFRELAMTTSENVRVRYPEFISNENEYKTAGLESII